eukprot:NODE_2274_length_1460_cov_110.899028_g2160_i0.p1 GENE.NODE_2274_length_1460_cov_110.899028_g2160_i0~~NODE_2274_length_1460_cov_110.899028_g2160_i0.p1  ORF type:complete len:416 (+),score=154.03 NODE_2274_length_1460_cov_110.899028_g2160_i0:57-1304(+)
MLNRALRRATPFAQKRFLNVHEYVGKTIMKQYGVDHERGVVVNSLDEIPAAFAKMSKEFGTEKVVVKSQILAGGRGKGTFDTGFQGGVHVATGEAEVKELASKMLGNILITKQTGAQGRKVSKLYLAECLNVAKEYYFAILMQGKAGGPVMVGSRHGGMDIEGVAAATPDEIHSEAINLKTGLQMPEATAFAKKIGFEGDAVEKAARNMCALSNLFFKTDATMIEINPLGQTDDGRVLCLDSKFNFDDSADFRQKEIHQYRDWEQEDPKEVEAEKHGLNYIALDGNIACLVNGAGLAMATMDIIASKGGSPANFLDVGGGATKETVAAAFKIITKDPNVKGILVNIFGGIMRCDTIAEGIVAAAKGVEINVPIVVRLNGTNQELGVEILKNSGMTEKIISAVDLEEAAKKIVSLV